MPCFQVPYVQIILLSAVQVWEITSLVGGQRRSISNLHICSKALCLLPLLNLSDSFTGTAVGGLESAMHALENVYCVLELSSCHLLGMVSLPNFSV